ncbi:ATP-dependent DNA helicase [Candidatus Woesearchaeota archaeon]|nr:ATP-dependent DNA helicase [Candidatus Woesearchaeota archaeon]
MKDSLFPHEEVRPIQNAMMLEVERAIENKKCLIAHAPTGLGKTAATLPIALKKAIKDNLTIFFLTSRHTQHRIAIETLKEIKKIHELNIGTVDIIGKKWMCLVPGIQILGSGDFAEYCRKQREDGKCEFYLKTRKKNKATTEAKYAVEKLHERSPIHIEEIMSYCEEGRLCPYEISVLLGNKAKVVVADYYYIFNNTIRDNFLGKINKELENCIIIIDEAHNLPARIRELNTHKISTFTIEKAVKEAKKLGYDDILFALQHLNNVLEKLSLRVENREVLITKEEFIKLVSQESDYEQLIGDLEALADEIRETQKTSSCGAVANFLLYWEGEDEGYARIFTKDFFRGKEQYVLAYRCLDPSITTKAIINSAYSVIAMSGTLKPAEMYRDLLGMPSDTVIREYKSPFPSKNRLTLVVPKTTTKFTMRSDEQFRNIAEVTAEIVNTVPGNTALFFPSYQIKGIVANHFNIRTKKTIFSEKPQMTKGEKEDLLNEFKKYSKTGACLLAVASGSFGEGIDLPGDYLKAVVIVGLPLSKPDLETQELIKYYDNKFGKGWDYGYLIPGMNKCLQSAGRCIRSETDIGVVVFLDERFVWQNYFRFFDREDVEVTQNYKEKIGEFFG